MPGYDLHSTIVAPATPPGHSALAVVRLSGADAWALAAGLLATDLNLPPPRQAALVLLELPAGVAKGAGTVAEQAVLTLWQGPASYTGEDMAELSVHGNPLLVRLVVDACTARGARPAEAGEFTYRAYVHGKLDLLQAEAVQQTINAGSTRGLQLAGSTLSGATSRLVQGWVEQLTTLLATIEVTHDYAADDLDATLDAAELATPERLAAELGKLSAQVAQAIDDARRTAPLLSGITIAICGPPNVGKSTLFNALLGTERALTGSAPGTTRDYLAEQVEASGLALKLVDTAGYHSAADAVEAQGVRRAGDWARAADCLLWVEAADRPRAGLPEALGGLAPQHVITRCDLLPEWPEPEPGVYHVSGRTGQGLDTLWQELVAIASGIELPALAAFTQRQAGQLAVAHQGLSAAQAGLDAGMPLDAVAADMYTARRELHAAYEQEDRGAVVAQVFSRFCVGK